ncbi:MAG TPA: hypothetical protein PKD85_20100, partial [Saprospiraceae bacterium]|nr:hypothetical protein [Saprospiraceae bacterium]
IITARKMIMTFSTEKYWGLKIPIRAISIIPADESDPINMPIVATIMMVLKLATLAPIAEFKKFTASLPTPTEISITATMAKMITAIKRNASKIDPFCLVMSVNML